MLETDMSASREFGVPGIGFTPGDHVCALFYTDLQRDQILLPYIQAGLVAGDKCVCVVDSVPTADVLTGLRPGVDVDGCVASHQLDVRAPLEAYVRAGEFTTENVMDYWTASVTSALGPDHYPFFRALGEMPSEWQEGPERISFFQFESELNQFPPGPHFILCLYNVAHFGGSVVMNVLKTHPKVLLGGQVFENPYYLSPDRYLAETHGVP
jgi:hypothetical protein